MPDDIAKLFAETLAGDYDDDAPWTAIHALHEIGSRAVFDIAAQWLTAPEPMKRVRGAEVLAQLGVGAKRPHAFPEEAGALLAARADAETEPRLRASAITGLGHIARPQTLPAILRAATDESALVRHAVAYALGSFGAVAAAQTCLLTLMRDPDEDVRDWATFGLGLMSDADSAEIRDAFVAGLDDPFIDVRVEAMAGLAKRRDPRVVAPLIRQLDALPEGLNGVIEAGLDFLGMKDMPAGWTARDLADALRRGADNVVPFRRGDPRRDRA